jgi:hypothetical protein
LIILFGKKGSSSTVSPSTNLKKDRSSEDFAAALGFFRRKDIRSLSTRVGYAFLPMKDYIVDIRPSLDYRRVYDFNDTLTDEEVRLGFFITGWRNSFIYGGYTVEMERYEGIDYHRKSFRAGIRSEPLSWFNGSFNFSFGDSIYYEENPFLGYKTSIGFTLTFKPLANLRALYTFRNDNFYENKGGERVYKVNIISQRISYQMTRASTRYRAGSFSSNSPTGGESNLFDLSGPRKIFFFYQIR